MSRPHRIDVHHHLVPPIWAEALSGHGGDPSGRHSPAWCSDSSLTFIDAQRIATAASRDRVTYSPKYIERCSGASSHHIRCLP